MKARTFTYFSIFFVLTALLLTAWDASASTAANTRIVNKATVTYAGGTASASVTVIVALVPSTPNIRITSGKATYAGLNTPTITDSIIITATANGPASYTVTPSISVGGTTNVNSANPASVNISNNPDTVVTLGATVTTGTSGQTFVTVPAADATGNDSPVNGIGIGSTILFTVHGNTYTRLVTGTVYDAVSSTYRLNWSDAIPAADIPAAGVLVAEQKSVSVTVLPGAVQTKGVPITVSVLGKVSTIGAADGTATTNPVNSWTSSEANASLTQYVRNATAAVAGSGAASFTVSGATNTYYTSGVTGKPGDTLEYVIVATNYTSSDLDGIALTDVVQTDLVTFVTAPGPYSGKEIFYSDTNAQTSTLVAAGTGANQASYVAPNLAVNVGLGAGAGTTGTIPVGKSVSIAYKVIIK
jgi:hypothetical protein